MFTPLLSSLGTRAGLFWLCAGLQTPLGTPPAPGRLRVGLPEPAVVRGLLNKTSSGEIDGFAKRLLAVSAAKVGLEIEFVELLGRVGVEELEAGRIDVLCPASVTEELIGRFSFSTPILMVNGAVFVRRGQAPPATIEDLRTQRVAVAGKGIGHRFCVEKGIPVEPMPTLESALQRVLDGSSDCVVTTQIAGRWEIERDGLSGLVDFPIDQDRLRQPFALALRSDASLEARLNRGLAMARDSGAWDELYEEFVEPYQPRPGRRSMLPFLAGILLVLLLVGAATVFVLRTRLETSQRALGESERTYQIVAEALPALVYTYFVGHDGNRQRRFATTKLEEWHRRFPCLEPGADYRSILASMHPDDRPRYIELTERSRTQAVRFEAEFRLRDGDGRYCWLHSMATPVAVTGGTVWHGLILDRTALHEAEEERHRLELQLAQAQRLESLGLMAGGIAHDFNNLLMEVRGNIELGIDSSDALTRSRRLKEALAAIERATERTRQLLASAGEARLVETSVDLAKVASDVAAKLSADGKPAIRVLAQGAPGAFEVRADAEQLEGVILQLLANALDAVHALPSGQVVLRLAVSGRTETELAGFEPRLEPGSYVLMEVEDNGVGMDQDALRRAFDPFFSTKFIGRGLGLSVVRRTVVRHGGALCLRSSSGEGTLFRVLLPRQARAEPLREAELIPFERASGQVLVVDDDERVLSVAAGLLEARGWTTRRALDAEQALASVRNAVPELVLLDLSMPGTDGLELLERLRRDHPDLPVVLMSGFSEAEVEDRECAADGFLSKPFSGAQLVAALERARARRAASSAS